MLKEKFNVAVVGATGAVGQAIVQILEERNFPIDELRLLASKNSVGKVVMFKGEGVTVQEANTDAFKGIDIALFSAGGSVSKALAPAAVKSGAIVVDNTSAYRMDANVPLIVPEVNIERAKDHNGIIANPNCSTIQMVVALKPILDKWGIKRIIVSTYQAVSGSGVKAVQELKNQSQAILEGKTDFPKEILPVGSLPKHYPIAFNAIPQIDVFEDNGYTKEEMKMVNETMKIFEDDSIQVTPTAVRIPVVNGHSESVYVETKESFTMDEVVAALSNFKGLQVVDQLEEQEYPMPAVIDGQLDVFVGRIRKDLYNDKGINMWVVADNLLKGAAWNAVQIAEYLTKTEEVWNKK
ncbi:aspartate-semialdehyde dehydrogenase [Desulfuribacillus stibiiarsenatis]|uniref:Aspartate-semialdehyde dehydrogenase n=1 Tax=Desulfuribacillus stibiiarsenatis TaxID=1390249 RepID=A0A1E5L6W8_9FIRM|nr:aspartate-semialdehyde dehydrogenase [Desulfuribacillus stibiiarsenatis]OEH85871.1 aspartate-semialdehyde dehydrogenase [Desulfuribacillus stibiiarsenatis]